MMSLLRRYYIFFLLLSVMAYLVYHLMSGNYSISHWLGNEPEIIRKQEHLQQLRARKEELENLTSRLGDDGLDLDLLEEEMRRRLHHLEKDEIIVDLPKEQDSLNAQ